MTAIVTAPREDLLLLLDYVQADEERDVEENPENDCDSHIVYVIRRLRKSLTSMSEGSLRRCACGRELHDDGTCPDGGAWCG